MFSLKMPLFVASFLLWGIQAHADSSNGLADSELQSDEATESNEAASETTKPLAQRLLEERIEELKAELTEAESELARLTGVPTDQADTVGEPMSGEETGALVVVRGDRASGSGFIAAMRGRTFFVTNIHVLGASRGASFTTVTGEEITLTPHAYLSRKRDLAIVPIEWSGSVLNLSPSLNFDKVGIGESVTVIGNSSGANVATRLTGSILGIGPHEIEVSAKFVPGNSGSPIIHERLGSVIGIASYLRDFRSDSKWTEDSEFNDIRRFGYRLDGEIEWQQIPIAQLHEEAEAYAQFEDRTEVMWNVSYQLRHESTLLTNYRDHESLGYLYEDVSSDFDWRCGTASSHNSQILKRFINQMLNESQNDLVDTEGLLQIEFYRRNYYRILGYRENVRKNLTNFADRRL